MKHRFVTNRDIVTNDRWKSVRGDVNDGIIFEY